jgi:hypothetical protein
VCWAEREDDAEAMVRRMWPQGAITGAALGDIARPKDFEAIIALLPPDALGGVVCGPDAERHVEAIARFAAAGFTEVYVHQVGPDQEGFFRFYADDVMPRL